MNLTPGLTAWQTSPTPGQCNLSSLRERKVSQWKMVSFHGNDLRQPSSFLSLQGNVLVSMKSYVTTGEAAPLLTPDNPIRSGAGNYHICQVVHQRVAGDLWRSNADSWAYRLGINCTGAQRHEMSYALFSSSWNNQFLGSSFVMETKHSVQGGIRKKSKNIDSSQGCFLMDKIYWPLQPFIIACNVSYN